MSKSFGKEIGLIHQAMMLAAKFGGDEQLWKAFVNNRGLLVYAIDYAAMVQGKGILCHVGETHAMVKIVCFSHTEAVELEEVRERVERFARFATDYEMEILSAKLQKLWDEADCPPLQYPIVGYAQENIAEHPESFLALTYGSEPKGRPKLLSQSTLKQRQGINNKITWPPGTYFAVVLKDEVCSQHTLGFSRLFTATPT